MFSKVNNRNTLLWGGTEKIKKDLEYIFPDLKILKCVSEDEDIERIDTKNNFIIIGKREEAINIDYIEEHGWKREENYITLNDIAKKISSGLNLYELKQDRTVVFWGTGAISKCYERIQGIEPDFYVDCDASKIGTTFLGKKVVSFDDARKLSDKLFFVIMTDNYYYEINDYLVGKDLTQGKDFIYYKKLFTNLDGDMFIKTLFDVQKDYPVCKYPFNRVVIYENGDVMCCCEGMKTAFGNLVLDSGEEVWGSMRAKLIRLSIVNKTYSFCRKDMCPYLMREFKEDEGRNEGLEVAKTPEWIGMGLDFTCNLYCQSCRNERRIAKGEDLKRIQSVAEKIVDTKWLDKAERSSIAGMGEALFSPTYRHLIFDNVDKKRKSITIGTNGMLITREVVERLNTLYDEVNFSVSIDAASEEIYKNIRRGGDFKKVKENISLLYDLKKEGRVKTINMVFVVQKDNYKEMKAFAEWGLSVEAILIFYALHNWGTYSDMEYAERSMIDLETRRLKPELEKVMQDPIWKRKDIIMDEIRNCSKSFD